MEFKIKIEKIKNRDLYVATSPDFTGLVVESDTIDEVKHLFQDALKGFIESYNQHYEQLPGKKHG